jgi:hypothetical protein
VERRGKAHIAGTRRPLGWSGAQNGAGDGGARRRSRSGDRPDSGSVVTSSLAWSEKKEETMVVLMESSERRGRHGGRAYAGGPSMAAFGFVEGE